MTDKRRKPDTEKRRPINCLVHPDTLRLLKPLAAHLRLSQGQVLDRAVAALAVAESFGAEHLRLRAPVEIAKLYEVKHSAQLEPTPNGDDACCKRCGNPKRLHRPRPNSAVDDGFGGDTFRWWHPFEPADASRSDGGE